MMGIAAAGAVAIGKTVADYVGGKAIEKVLDTAAEKIGDVNLRKYILDKTTKAAESVQLTECTRKVFDSENKKFNTIRKGFANAVLRWNSNGMREFITDPPCVGECLMHVANDIVVLIRVVKNRLWEDDRFREIMGKDRFQEVLYQEFSDMKAEFEAFKEKMNEMEIALKVLTDEVAELREAKPPDPELVNRIMSTPSAFIGRKDEIRSIGEEFERSNTVFVTGIGGIGKTEVCREYAFRCMNSGQKVAWLTFSGSTKATISSGLEFRNLDVSSMNENDKFAEKVRWIPGDALIVMDNYVQEEDMTDLLSLPCRVLVSTRMTDGADSIEIKPLSKDDAFSLLRSRVHPALRTWADENRKALEDVLEGMERLTIMITLVAGIINERRPDLKSLASDIFGMTGKVSLTKDGRTERTDMLGHFRTLMARSELSKEEKEILKVMSITPPGGIRSNILEELAGIDGDSAYRLIGLGLIRNEYGSEYIFRSIHPMVAEFVMADDPPTFAEGELCRTYVDNLSQKTKEIRDSGSPVGLGPYIGAILSAAEILKVCEEYALASSCLYTFSRGLSEFGMHRESLSLASEELSIRQTHMPEDLEDMATSYNNVGIEYGELGVYDKAMEYLHKAVEIHKNDLPENAPEGSISFDFAKLYSNIAKTYSNNGDHNKAIEYYYWAMKACEISLPKDHPDLAMYYDNLGDEYGNGDSRIDHEMAWEYINKGYQIRMKTLPENHPDIAMSYDSIGREHYRLGNTDEALEYFCKALKIREKVLPENHPDLGTSYTHIGTTYETIAEP